MKIGACACPLIVHPRALATCVMVGTSRELYKVSIGCLVSADPLTIVYHGGPNEANRISKVLIHDVCIYHQKFVFLMVHTPICSYNKELSQYQVFYLGTERLI